MANKRIKDLTEKSSFVSGDYFPIDNDNGTKKVNASKIMSPLSSAQTDATRALNMARNTSSFPTGDAYSPSSSYKVGNMVIYNNTLYRCKTACSAASWSVNANNFEAISLASAITDLNNDLSNLQMKQVEFGSFSIKPTAVVSSPVFGHGTTVYSAEVEKAFSKNFSSPPYVFVTVTDTNGTYQNFGVKTPTSTSFRVNVVSDKNNTTYTVRYMAIEI